VLTRLHTRFVLAFVGLTGGLAVLAGIVVLGGGRLAMEGEELVGRAASGREALALIVAAPSTPTPAARPEIGVPKVV